MSKFTFTREGAWHVLNTNGAPQARYTEKALIELHAAISAHLAEHNSGVMGGRPAAERKCVCIMKGMSFEFDMCNGAGYFPDGQESCAHPARSGNGFCGHDQACHSTQNTKDQEEDK